MSGKMDNGTVFVTSTSMKTEVGVSKSPLESGDLIYFVLLGDINTYHSTLQTDGL